MNFKYFRDPDNFAFRVDEDSECAICGKLGLWFDAGGFYGEHEIDCICDSCLSAGKLKELEIEINQVLEGEGVEKDVILYQTPALPTWQDRFWPFIDGEYCIFERMASKEDFLSQEEFKNSFSEFDKDSTDLEWLWSILPERRIDNHVDGNFDVSVYLFTRGNKKHCIWDAN